MSPVLSGEQRKIVEDVLSANLPDGFEVRVFGSRARGSPRPLSDLDLAVIGPSALTLSQLADLAEAFCESDLPFKVDIVDLLSVDPAFRERVEREAVAL